MLNVDHVLASYGQIDEILLAYSKSEPIGQCSKFLECHKIRALTFIAGTLITDTASAAKYVSERHIPYIAAICSNEAAEHYGVPVVRRGIANQKVNQTEFHVYQRRDDGRDLSAHIRPGER